MFWALLTSFPYWRAAAIRSGPTCARGTLTTVRGSTGPGVFALGAAVSQPSALGAVGAFALGAAGAFALGPVGGGSSAPSSAAPQQGRHVLRGMPQGCLRCSALSTAGTTYCHPDGNTTHVDNETWHNPRHPRHAAEWQADRV